MLIDPLMGLRHQIDYSLGMPGHQVKCTACRHEYTAPLHLGLCPERVRTEVTRLRERVTQLEDSITNHNEPALRPRGGGNYYD